MNCLIYVLFPGESKRQNAVSLKDGEVPDGDEDVNSQSIPNEPIPPGDGTESMDDEDDSSASQSAHYNTRSRKAILPFSLSVLNMTGTTELSQFTPGTELDFRQDTFLAVNLHRNILSTFMVRNLETHGRVTPITLNPTFNYLYSPKAKLSLDECIYQFTSLEKLGADDPWYCPRCKQHQMASKKFDIWFVI